MDKDTNTATVQATGEPTMADVSNVSYLLPFGEHNSIAITF